MSEQNFSVVFRGDIVKGENLVDVKLRLKKIFKVNDSKIEALFSGRPVSLKTSLSDNEAGKYQRVLKQAGIIVAIENNKSDNNKGVDKRSKQNVNAKAKNEEASLESAKSNTPQKNTPSWSLAPVGSLLQDKKIQDTPELDINLDHLSLKSQEGNLISDGERITDSHSIIDVDILDWELTPYGESLIKDSERVKEKAISVDISSLNVVENEGNLLDDSERKTIEPADIDTSHLSLLPDK